jgi:crotonobetainyl-CoA:carnitine CoA-transferase CaiB-like acyl-CoA transferase
LSLIEYNRDEAGRRRGKVKGALEGVRVVEVCEGVAGPYCGRLLADLGAEVIKVERPEAGDWARRRGPFPGDRPDAEKSGLFLCLNMNKRGVTLALEAETGREVFRKLVRGADIVLEDRGPGAFAGVGRG